MLIAVEGVDGAGTTTQSERLVDWLLSAGHSAHLTREPSTGPVGALIRQVLGGAHSPFDRSSLALLFAADRLDHLTREIEPARRRGAIVVTDRYIMSSLVYQSLDAPPEFVAAINRLAVPADLTVLVDVPVEVAAERRKTRGGAEELFDALEVQRRLVEAYRKAAERALHAGERVVIIDGSPDAETVFLALRNVVAEACSIPLGPSSSTR